MVNDVETVWHRLYNVELEFHEPSHFGGILRRHTDDVGACRQVSRVDFHLFGEALLAEDLGAGDVEHLNVVDGFASLNGQFVADGVGIDVEAYASMFFDAFDVLYVGDESAVVGDGEGVVLVIRHDEAILGPIQEGVAVVKDNLQSDFATIGKGACTFNDTTLGRINGSADDIVNGSKVGVEVTVACDDEGITGVGRHNSAILGPVSESVTGSRRGNYGARLAFLIGAATGDGATLSGFRRHGDGVHGQRVLGEVSHYVGVAGYGEGERGVGRHETSVLGPIDESAPPVLIRKPEIQ